jgi:hypothetical protein
MYLALLVALCRPERAHAQTVEPLPPVLNISLDEATPLGPRQRVPLRARLANSDGEPIAGAWIIFFANGRRDGQARTDAQGQAAWRLRQALAAGSHNIQASFAGLPGVQQASVTLQLRLEAAQLTLQAAPARVGEPLQLAGRLSRASGVPIAGGTVTILLEGKRVGTGRSDSNGAFALQVRRAVAAGTYQVEAAFEGQASVLPARAATQVSVSPAWVEIETVPRLAGARFALNGQQFVADQSGLARIAVERAGQYTLSALPWDADTTGIHATFARWEENVYTPQRSVRLPADGWLQAGFDLSYQVRVSLLDLNGQAVDPTMASSIMVTSTDRIRYTLSPVTPRWLPGSRVVRMEHGLVSRPVEYSAGSVIVDGSNVVNQGQQRFDPTQRQQWPIRLALYSTRFIVRDAMFGYPVDTKLQLSYPDGASQIWPLGADGELTVGLMARGGYTARVHAPGISAVIPIVLSRNQEVRLLVISYLDLAVLAVVLGSIGLGLLFIGRPQLLLLLRSPRALVQELARIVLAMRTTPPWRREHRLPRERLRPLDPMLIVALCLLLLGASGVTAASQFTTAPGNSSASPTRAATTTAPATRAALVMATAAPPPTTTATTAPPPSPQPTATRAIPPTSTALPAPPTPDKRTILTFSSPLRRNSEGPEVARLQQRLRELGYFAYPENSGQFGALTEAAVMSFQADRGLPTTGLAGPQTISALNNCDAACARSNTGEEVAP